MIIGKNKPTTIRNSKNTYYFLLCLNGVFFIHLYDVVIFYLFSIRVVGHDIITSFLPVLLYAIMVWFGIKEYYCIRSHYRILNTPFVLSWISIYKITLYFMLLQLPYNILIKDSGILSSISDTVVWFLPVIAIFSFEKENMLKMKRLFIWQAAISCVVIIISFPLIMQDLHIVSMRATRIDLQDLGGGILGPIRSLLFGGVFLLLLFNTLKLWERIISIIIVIFSLYISVLGQFRSGVISFALTISLAWIIIPLRLGALRHILVSVLFLIFVTVLIQGSGTDELADMTQRYESIKFGGKAFEKLQARFFSRGYNEGTEGSIMYRIEESRQALSESNPIQLLVGQGIGSTWTGGTLYGAKREMLHLGIGHLLFRGGIPLLVLFLIFPFGVGLVAFIRSRNPLILACAGVILLRIISLFISNQFDLNLSYVLTFLCAGRCLREFDISKHHHPIEGKAIS
jgi:hypothetical protein